MELFELVNNEVTFSPQALELKPFKALWDRDKTKKKEKAKAELAFVYYFSDYKSDFAKEPNDNQRALEILKSLSLKTKPDKTVYKACDFYKEKRNTIIIEMLMAARTAAIKIKEYYLNIDLLETDEKGKPIWDITKLQNSLKDLTKTIEGLDSLEDRVKRETSQESNMRGNKPKAIFEDGF